MATSKYGQCNKRLAECLGHMFDTATSYDVTFVVGRNREVIHAHKCILISRSPVFQAMFEGPLSEKGNVTVTDIDTNVFKMFLRYLYTDDIKLTCYNVTYLLYTAKKYFIDTLTQECRKFLKLSLNPDNACTLLEDAHICMDDPLSTECRKMIFDNPKLCLKTPGFTDLCRNCISNIIQSDDLMTSEDEVVKAVLRWSEAECKRQMLDVNDANKTQVLGDVIDTVRFPCLDDLILKLSPSKQFNAVERVTRFGNLDKSYWNYPIGNRNAISFKMSGAVNFHGIGVYGLKQGVGAYSTALRVYDHNGTIIEDITRTILTDQSADIFDFRLNIPLHLKPFTEYTVTIETEEGLCTKCGLNGVEAVSVRGIDVHFINSKRSKTGTCISEGQIPCLLLS